MTFQRFVRRNFLIEGDYAKPPPEWSRWWQHRGYVPDAYTLQERVDMDRANEERKLLADRLSLMLGDLRRLERDSQDEGATARYIAARTGIDAEQVAAVLKEFIGW